MHEEEQNITLLTRVVERRPLVLSIFCLWASMHAVSKSTTPQKQLEENQLWRRRKFMPLARTFTATMSWGLFSSNGAIVRMRITIAFMARWVNCHHFFLSQFCAFTCKRAENISAVWFIVTLAEVFTSLSHSSITVLSSVWWRKSNFSSEAAQIRRWISKINFLPIHLLAFF